MFLHADARFYARTAVCDLSREGDTPSISGLFFTLAPAMPEPGTHGLMALGLAGLSLAARRRQRS